MSTRISADAQPFCFARGRISSQGNSDMNKDRIVGAAKQAKGAVKEATGKVIGDANLEVEGRADKAEGKIQSAIGDAKDALKK
jgi:uncharacterized protein YjbJ (UPF0337 family)